MAIRSEYRQFPGKVMAKLSSVVAAYVLLTLMIIYGTKHSLLLAESVGGNHHVYLTFCATAMTKSAAIWFDWLLPRLWQAAVRGAVVFAVVFCAWDGVVDSMTYFSWAPVWPPY